MPTTIAYTKTYADALKRRFVEEAKQNARTVEREEWIQNRTEQIVNDDDYLPDLVASLLDTGAGVNVFLHLRNATFGDAVGALAHYHEFLTKEARKIAESEANRRFNYVWN